MSTPDPVQQPQKEEHKPVVLMSSQTRNLIVATAAVVILLTVMAWSGSARTEAAKKKGLAADVAALAVALKYPLLEANSMRTAAGRERLQPMAVEIGKAGDFKAVVITDVNGNVLATTKGPLESAAVVKDLPSAGVLLGRNQAGITAASPIKLGDSTLGYLFVETDR